MKITQVQNRIDNSHNYQAPSFGGIFRISIYNFLKENRKISRELLKDTFCQNGSIRIDGRQYPKKRILDLYTYFICNNENDQYFINKLRKMGLDFDCCDESEAYAPAIRAMTIISEKCAAPIKCLYPKS